MQVKFVFYYFLYNKSSIRALLKDICFLLDSYDSVVVVALCLRDSWSGQGYVVIAQETLNEILL